jgi:hypothetical protein
VGGGLYVTGGTVTLTNVTFSSNTAQGGNGGAGVKNLGITLPGANGGNGLGGGLAVGGATVCSMVNCTVENNSANGGTGGNKGGKRGLGYGGGLYIEALAAVSLDAFTQANVKNNVASTNHANIYGSYTQS